jgi:hypothetical protein
MRNPLLVKTLDTGGTTGTVLGQRDKCLVAHAWEEDSIESKRCEQATFLGLSGGFEADTVLVVTGVERIREGLTVTEGVFSRHSLSH